MKFILSALLVAFISCHAVAQETNEVSADSYEVYSALLVQHYGASLKQKVPVLIYRYTVPTFQDHAGVEEQCRSRIGQDVVLKRLLDKLVVEKQRFRIDSKLKLDGNFKIIDRKIQVQEGSQPGVIYLSPVAFSENKKVAMAWMSNSCGSLCGTGFLWVLNKQTDGWHPSSERLYCGFIR